MSHDNGRLFIRRTGSLAQQEWSREELKAAVEAYVEMLHKHYTKQKFVKTQIYKALGQRFGRSPKAFEYRLQNISAIYEARGRQWLPGLKPAQHIGSHIAAQLQELIEEVEAVSRPEPPRPRGVRNPQYSLLPTKQFSRNVAVQEWVLFQAQGRCECCEQPAPFLTANGIPYLEVHHVRHLEEWGTDTPENTVAVCPNCHRELHHGEHKAALKSRLYEKVSRLVKE